MVGAWVGVMKTSTAPSSHDTLLLDHFLSLLLLSPLSATVKRWCLYEFARAAIAKDHRVRGLNYRNSIFSQFWRLEAWFQGVGGVGFFWGVSPRFTDGCLLPRFADGCLLPRFADGCLLPLLHTDRLASVCVCVLGALLLRTLVILNLGLHEWPRFILITSLKALSPKTSHTLRY